MGKGMKHYTEDGLYSGETHKMDDGSLHTGKTHTKTSKVVSHKKEGPFRMKGYTYPGTSPVEKKVSWEWDGKTHYGDYIREDSKYVYARTVNGKIKKKPKK
tara:strand:- start:41 stop:343 length:303 start_codon:yes stop_codon:yes gene_type:complete